MFYVILIRILRRHVLFHLVIPLAAGVLVEALYTRARDHIAWNNLPREMLSGRHIALYLGVAAAYLTVIGLLVRRETNIGLRRIELHDLAAKLRGAKSLFAVAPTPLGEWFDPAAQVYFATLLGERLTSTSTFRYERVLFIPSRKSRKYLNSDYLDGYFAKCLIDIHKHLGIFLYFLEWSDIENILDQLGTEEKILIGYYPSPVARLPDYLTKALMLPLRRRRVRRIAGGVIEPNAGTKTVFGFAKRENVVDVEVQPRSRAEAYLKFVDLIKGVLYENDNPGTVKLLHDFTKYYTE